MTVSTREVLRSALEATAGDDPSAWRVTAELLRGLEGSTWLRLDRSARTYGAPTLVDRSREALGRPGHALLEPTVLVAVMTSMHPDGRLREHATRALGGAAGQVAAAALAVRTFDHVPNVRDAAWRSLDAVLVDAATAEVVLDVVLAGRARTLHPDPVARVRHRVLTTVGACALRTSSRRTVRRWAFTDLHGDAPLGPDDLVRTALHDEDQWVRAWSAQQVAASGDVVRLLALLTARSVEVRAVALDSLPAAALDEALLVTLLLDRAPRVRELALTRARVRGVDAAAVHRAARDDVHAAAWLRAACLLELAAAGDSRDLAPAVDALADPAPRVRAAAVRAVLALAPAADVVDLLVSRLRDPSTQVTRTAAVLLARRGLPRTHADALWASDDPAHRLTAWRLASARGGWDRVEADVRAAADPGPDVAACGRGDVRSWLAHSATTTWGRPSADQHAILTDLLPQTGLPARVQRSVRFHAGMPREHAHLHEDAGVPGQSPALARTNPPQAATPTTRERRGWLRPWR